MGKNALIHNELPRTAWRNAEMTVLQGQVREKNFKRRQTRTIRIRANVVLPSTGAATINVVYDKVLFSPRNLMLYTALGSLLVVARPKASMQVSDMDNTESDKAFLNDLLHYTPALTWEEKNPDSKLPNYCTALSTFLVSIDRDWWFLIGSGHISKPLVDRLKAGKIFHAVQIVDYASQGSPNRHPIPFPHIIDTPNGSIYIEDSGIDFWWCYIDSNIVSLLKKNGMRAIPESEWKKPPKDLEVFNTLGYPDENEHPVEGGEGVIKAIRIKPRLIPYIPCPKPPDADSSDAFQYFQPVPAAGKDRTNLQGMSGGPVFGYKDAESDKPRRYVVGVQSGQLPTSGVATVGVFGEVAEKVLKEAIHKYELAPNARAS